MTNAWKDRIIGGLLATVAVLSYVAVLKPLSRPTFGDAPTCWQETTKTHVEQFCGEAGQVNWKRFDRWVSLKEQVRKYIREETEK